MFARRCAFVPATVGIRSLRYRGGVAMAVLMGSAARAVSFAGSKRRVTSFHVAGLALCNHNSQKSLCVTAQYLRDVL